MSIGPGGLAMEVQECPGALPVEAGSHWRGEGPMARRSALRRGGVDEAGLLGLGQHGVVLAHFAAPVLAAVVAATFAADRVGERGGVHGAVLVEADLACDRVQGARALARHLELGAR